MFKHIVMWRLKEDRSGKTDMEHAELIKSTLERLPSLISEIVSYEVGIDLQDGNRSFDVVLISEFQNQRDFETYRSHPEHIKVVETIRELTLKARFVDFLTER